MVFKTKYLGRYPKLLLKSLFEINLFKKLQISFVGKKIVLNGKNLETITT